MIGNMLPELGRIGPIVIRSYSLMLDLAILIGLGALAWHGGRAEDRHTRWLDAGLVAVIAGLVGGRLEHVLIHWGYFADHSAEIPQFWLGGLEWHLAVIFGLIALAAGCRAWKINFRQAVDVIGLIAPVAAALIFGGCWLSACGYGQEVDSLADYPRFVAAELPDMYGIVAPRLNTQVFGIVAGLILTGVAVVLARRIHRSGTHFWIILALLAATLFALGALRGDPIPMVGVFRLDQLLDLGVTAVALAGLYFSLRQPARAEPHKG